MDEYSSAAASKRGFQVLPQQNRDAASPSVPGASQHSAIFSSSLTFFKNDLLSFLSYIKTSQIPIFSVALPDVRSVLGRGASFFVNGAEMPETCIDDVSGEAYVKGSLVALKRAIVPADAKSIQEGLTRRIKLLSNEVLTMKHPPLAAHPNIAQLLGIGFEVEGHESDQNVMPFLVPECAELGNLAEILETAKREDRPLRYDRKLAFCVDIAHGLEALHACDIIHGDVKCENVLVFETTGPEIDQSVLSCKIIDFGFSHVDAFQERFALGGSPPWQAPELLEGQYFKVESAKKTDIYSFGLLIWRLMLDGDPFEPLESFEGETEKEKRHHRNEGLASLKHQDLLIDHVCSSLTLSGVLDQSQLKTICRIMQRTLARDPSRRESSLQNIIKLLNSDFWYQSRQLVVPERVSLPHEIELLDIEKHYHELRKVDGVVKEKIAKSYCDMAQGSRGSRSQYSGAMYQLAVCYTLGFGVPFAPKESVRWLEIAAMNGFQRAKEVLPHFRMVFDEDLNDYVIPLTQTVSELTIESGSSEVKDCSYINTKSVQISGSDIYLDGKIVDGKALLVEAVRTHDKETSEILLANGVLGNASTDEGVTAFHYLTTWDTSQARELIVKLVKAGGNIDSRARRGISMGGTPLMWSVYEDRMEHSKVLLEHGASATAKDTLGVSALSLCARLHVHLHLRLLLMHTKPIELEQWLYRLMVEAVSGESRLSRIVRHGRDWETVGLETFKILQAWHSVFPSLPGFSVMLLSALRECFDSSFGPSNTDIHVRILDTYGIAPADCATLLGDSILTDNQTLFDHLISKNVPAVGQFSQGKTLLHLCAQNPNNTTTIKYFGEELLKQPGVDINARDTSGQTPFMDALLARKWDLAWYLLEHGADGLATTNDGFTVIGLIIRTLNLGAAKWAFNYSGKGDMFRQKGFIINPMRNISAIQEAARLKLPRAHGMKTEVSGLFLYIVTNFLTQECIDFRSDGILPNASALDIAAINGNVHAVKALVKRGAAVASGKTAFALAKEGLKRFENEENHDSDIFLARKSLERCVYIIEHWEQDPKGTEREADKWTKLHTIDEDNIKDSWEVVAWEWQTGD